MIDTNITKPGDLVWFGASWSTEICLVMYVGKCTGMIDGMLECLYQEGTIAIHIQNLYETEQEVLLARGK